MDVGASPRTGFRERRVPIAVTAVIPALNEEPNIGWRLERLPACLDEAIVVDGRSTDHTIFATRCARPHARIVQERAPGKGAAVRAGLRIAEVPSFEADRRFGDSNLRTFRDGARVLRELVRARAVAWPPAPEPAPADETGALYAHATRISELLAKKAEQATI